ncbi:prenyltransferase/squalene oxidase repeat-containing protein [Kitasatospora camelliae]|uniref:Prenyltransferase/squalene oxidase repeat-containing protein n=1 Tax=Kitasatospora camelliae TaxID=3156397 RepID=A0AAU8JUB8_9ACTN
MTAQKGTPPTMLTSARAAAAALAGLLLAGTVCAPALADETTPAATASPSPAPTAPAALFGKGDPQYDGVWRQSLALTALARHQAKPAESAVAWLTAQQCTDGGWPSFRADASVACDPKKEDSNATAVAVQALVALGGHQERVGKAVRWLKEVQNADGSWAFNPGDPGDANSTGLAVDALLAAGTDPAQVARGGRNAYDALSSFQLGCASAPEKRGAFAYQPEPDGSLKANMQATAPAAFAAAGGRLPLGAPAAAKGAPAQAPACAEGSSDRTVPHADSAEAGAAYLAAQLGAGGGHLVLDTPGATPGPDFNSTAWAALALIQAGHADQAAPAVGFLTANGRGWAAGPEGTNVAAAATLLLVADATGQDPKNVGGTDLVGLLAAAGPDSSSAAAVAPAKKKGGPSTLWVVGVGLLIGVGGGLLLSLQRNRRSPGA